MSLPRVHWGLAALPEVLRGRRTLLFATPRWEAPVHTLRRVSSLPTDAPIDATGAQVLLALGGGSTIDTAKRVSAESGLPLVSVPTTYSGAEWTEFYGVRSGDRRRTGAGRGANLEAIVYDVPLTLGMPREVTGGTALNALAHCCEALYVKGRDVDADSVALEGAALIDASLPEILADLEAPEPRATLLRGAARGGEALARSGLALAHAIAQVLGGRYGIAHGALNAIALPLALRFNAEYLPPQLLGGRAADRAAELARLAGFTSLRALGVPAADLPSLAEEIARVPGARANPREVAPADALELLRAAL